VSERGLTVRLRQSSPIALDAEISCARGELLALVGPSGSGKTTLLKAIAGLLRVRSGLINCGDETWLDTDRGIHVSPQQRRVGVVFQQYALFPHLSALANVMEALHDLPSLERRARGHAARSTPRYPALGRKPRTIGSGSQIPAHRTLGLGTRSATTRRTRVHRRVTRRAASHPPSPHSRARRLEGSGTGQKRPVTRPVPLS